MMEQRLDGRGRQRSGGRQQRMGRGERSAERAERTERDVVVMRRWLLALVRGTRVADDRRPVQRQRQFHIRHHGAEGELRDQRKQGAE